MTAKTTKNDPPTPPASAPQHQAGESERNLPTYALASLAAFCGFLIVLIILITNAERLSRFGILQQVYYLLLIPMSLTAGAFLFGVLPSSAAYVGKFWGGRLRLSRAVVGAALVVVGGYCFIPKTTTFPLTVYVHGDAGPQDIVLRNYGHVVLKLGPDSRSEQIGENGQAFFPAIPADFRGKQIQAWVESDSYEAPQIEVTVTGTSLDLEVKKKTKYFELAGTVLDSLGKPLPGVRVAVPECKAETKTNDDGWFGLTIAADSQRMVDLIAEEQGYETKRFSLTLGDPGTTISLKRIP